MICINIVMFRLNDAYRIMDFSGKRQSQGSVRRGILVVIVTAKRVRVISYGGAMVHCRLKKQGLNKTVVSGIWMIDWVISISSILKDQLHMAEFLSWIRSVKTFFCFVVWFFFPLLLPQRYWLGTVPKKDGSYDHHIDLLEHSEKLNRNSWLFNTNPESFIILFPFWYCQSHLFQRTVPFYWIRYPFHWMVWISNSSCHWSV